MADWTSDRIENLRTRLGLTRPEMATILYGYTDPQKQTKAMYRLETGRRSPSGPLGLTLDRLEDGRLDPEAELEAIENAHTAEPAPQLTD